MPILSTYYISCISLRTRYTLSQLEVERDVMGKGKSDPQASNQTAFVDMRELLHRWPVSRATVYRTIKRGELAPRSGSANEGSLGQKPLSNSSSALSLWLNSGSANVSSV